MTEASGIANDETDRALGTRPASAAENHPPLFNSRQAAERLSGRRFAN